MPVLPKITSSMEMLWKKRLLAVLLFPLLGLVACAGTPDLAQPMEDQDESHKAESPAPSGQPVVAEHSAPSPVPVKLEAAAAEPVNEAPEGSQAGEQAVNNQLSGQASPAELVTEVVEPSSQTTPDLKQPLNEQPSADVSSVDTQSLPDEKNLPPEDPATDLEYPSLPSTDPFQQPPNWLDKSQNYVASSGDSLANWLDSFFGDPESDVESAYSLIRIAVIYDIDEVEDNEVALKLRGKLQLPKLSKRTSLVFSGDDDDGDDSLAIRGEDADNDQVALQYSLKESRRSRYDIFGGFRAGLKYKVGVRYRWEDAPSEQFFYRFREELAYDQDDHAISTTRLDFNYLIKKGRLTRWSNRVRYGQETDGAEWRSSVSWQERLAETKAMTYFVAINGITDPTKLIKSYGPGVRYRQNIFRKYLFFDVGTAYGWRKKEADVSRKGAWSVEIQLEMFFEKQRNKKKKKKKKN